MRRSLFAARIAGSLLTLALSSTAVHAQVGTIRGKVVDSTGAPISGALIAVDRTAVRTQASSSGTYTLLGVPAGTRTVRAQIIGFAPRTV